MHSKAKYLYACEWNEVAAQWLKENLGSNKIPDSRYVILTGFAPKNVAQRINLGLIHDCRKYWKTACEALSSETGGTLRIHENVNMTSSPSSPSTRLSNHSGPFSNTKPETRFTNTYARFRLSNGMLNACT